MTGAGPGAADSPADSAPDSARRPPGLVVAGIGRARVRDAGFTLRPGRCLAIVGPSGGGKSVLLRAIADLDPHEGRVTLDGADRDAMAAPAWRRQVCYVPAESGWWAPRVGDHFADRAAAAELIQALGLPAEALDWAIERLSTGERQRLALARALAGEPRVLLLDEPTSGLDGDAAARVEALLRRRLDTGLILVMVTHDRRLAARLAERTLRMEAGTLAAEPAAGEQTAGAGAS